MVENQSVGAPSFRVLCGGWEAAREWQETANGLTEGCPVQASLGRGSRPDTQAWPTTPRRSGEARVRVA
jgi:hypothetical protein